MILLALVVPAYLVGADIQAIEDVFGKSDTYVLMVPRGNAAREKELSAALGSVMDVPVIPAAGLKRHVRNVEAGFRVGQRIQKRIADEILCIARIRHARAEHIALFKCFSVFVHYDPYLLFFLPNFGAA